MKRAASVALLLCACNPPPRAASAAPDAAPPAGERSLPSTRWPQGTGPRAPSETWVGGVLTGRRSFEGDDQIDETFAAGKLRTRVRRALSPPPGLRSREVRDCFPLVTGDPVRRFTTAVDAKGIKTVLEEVDPAGRGAWRRAGEERAPPSEGGPRCPGDPEDPFR